MRMMRILSCANFQFVDFSVILKTELIGRMTWFEVCFDYYREKDCPENPYLKIQKTQGSVHAYVALTIILNK